MTMLDPGSIKIYTLLKIFNKNIKTDILDMSVHEASVKTLIWRVFRENVDITIKR